MGVSERVKKIIQRRGLSQEDLGRKIGLDKSSMSKLLNKKRKVEEVMLLKLSEVLGVSSDYLLGIVDDPDQVLVIEETEEQRDMNELINFIRSTKRHENIKVLLDVSKNMKK